MEKLYGLDILGKSPNLKNEEVVKVTKTSGLTGLWVVNGVDELGDRVG